MEPEYPLDGFDNKFSAMTGKNISDICNDTNYLQSYPDDIRMISLKYYSYGIVLPAICGLGIVGNILNLIVLTRPTMKGPAYVYMRGYAGGALCAMFFAVPFSGRILLHNEVGPWESYVQAFFHTRLELYLGNACIGVAVLMLIALTVERYVAVCRLGQGRPLAAKKAPRLVFLIVLFALLLYSPYVMRALVVPCPDTRRTEKMVYRIQEHPSFSDSVLWAAYLWILEAIFKIGPMLLIVYLNFCIIVAYRKTCAKRRKMTQKISSPDTVPLNKDPNSDSPSVSTLSQEESRKFSEEHRLVMLLGSTSGLFFICTTPQLVLSLMIHEAILKSYAFQVFRAIANVLELTNYSITFYIYCLLSREFRATILRTFRLRRPKQVNLVGQAYL